jgi:hypothetical protein
MDRIKVVNLSCENNNASVNSTDIHRLAFFLPTSNCEIVKCETLI